MIGALFLDDLKNLLPKKVYQIGKKMVEKIAINSGLENVKNGGLVDI